MLGQTGFEANGTFWLATDTDKTCDGSLSIAGPKPRVEVVGEMTPSMEVTVRNPDGSVTMAPTKDDAVDLIIHGSVSETPGRITIFDAMSGDDRNRSR